MSGTAGEPDGPRDRRPADPEQRRPRSSRRIAAVAGGIIVVVLVVWLVLYFAARNQAAEGSASPGRVAGPGAGTVVAASTLAMRLPAQLEGG